MNAVRKITNLSNSLGWSVDTKVVDKNNITFTFSRHTPRGLDFSFYAELLSNRVYTLIGGIYDYFKGFDPDYASLHWIGEDGHGRDGAPFHIKDIVDDMQEAKNLVYNLFLVLYDGFRR